MLDKPGGVAEVVINLHTGLKRRGHTVKVITQRTSGYKGQVPEDYILFGVTRKFKGGFGTEGNWGMPADSDEIAKILEQEQFDVINFHEPWLPMLAWQMLKHSKTAHVGTFHANLVDTAAGKTWTSSIFTPYGRPLLKKMDIFTATSHAPAAMLINRANTKDRREMDLIQNIKYIPCGIDLRTYRPVKKRVPLKGPGTKSIFYVGRLERRKGVDYLVKAFGELVREIPEAHLVIAGEGGRKSRLQQLVELNKIPNVEFVGYVDDDEKRRLLGNADLACFPSIYGEGFGIVLLEAMAMGVPVVAGNNLGYVNVMKGPGRVGLVDPRSTKDFANRLAVFLNDNDQRKLMSGWGLREVKKYDYTKVVVQYEAAYKEAIMLLRSRRNKQSLVEPDRQLAKLGKRMLLRRSA